MSDTPRTDDEEVCDSEFSDWGYGPSGFVRVDFARQLEREIARWKRLAVYASGAQMPGEFIPEKK